MVKCELQDPVGQSEEELAAAGQSEEELAAAEQAERELELAQLEEEETKRILQAKTLELGQTEDDLELELRGAPEEMLREAEDEAEDTEEDIPPTQEDIPPTQPEPVTPPKALPAEVQEELLTAAASVRPETMDSEDVRKLQLSMRAQEREKKEAAKAAKDAEKTQKAAKEPKPKGRPRKREVEGAAAAEGPKTLPTKRLKRKTTLEAQAEDHGEEQKSETKEAPAKAKRTAAKEDPKKKKGQETEEKQEKSEKKSAPAKTKRTTAKEDPKKKKGQETEEEQEKSEKKKAPAKTKRTTAKEDPAKKKKKGQETEEEQEKSDSKKKASPKKKAEKAEDKKKKTKATAEKGPKEVAATLAERSEDPVVPAAKRFRKAAGGGDLAAADPQLKAEMIGVIKNFDNKEYDRKGETMHHGKYGNDVQVVVYWTRSSVGVKLCLNGGWAQRYYYSFKDATIALNIFLAAKMCAKLQEKGLEWHRTADCTEYDKMLRATATAAVQCAHD